MKGFFIGMKVTLQQEVGVVVAGTGNSDWDKEPGIICWDTPKPNDLEDWRGLWGAFVSSGGKQLDASVELKHIDEAGKHNTSTS